MLCKNAQMEDWDDYKFILAVGRHGGLSAAARALNVNHSTVSRRITSAEEKLGARLFDRLQNGFIPTDAGQQAIDVAERLEQELFALNRSIASRDKNLAGTLRITAAQLIFQSSVAEIISKFMRLYPQITITVSASNENLNLNQREADVAIRVGNEQDPNLFGRRVTKQNRGYYASKTYLGELGDLESSRPCMTPIKCISFFWWGKKVSKEVKTIFPNAQIAMQLDDMIAVHSAVKQGIGIGRMPCFLGDSDPSFARVPGLTLAPGPDIWVLTHHDLKKVERVRVFMQFVAAEFKKKETLYLGHQI